MSSRQIRRELVAYASRWKAFSILPSSEPLDASSRRAKLVGSLAGGGSCGSCGSCGSSRALRGGGSGGNGGNIRWVHYRATQAPLRLGRNPSCGGSGGGGGALPGSGSGGSSRVSSCRGGGGSGDAGVGACTCGYRLHPKHPEARHTTAITNGNRTTT
jgi:hypothetical protein